MSVRFRRQEPELGPPHSAGTARAPVLGDRKLLRSAAGLGRTALGTLEKRPRANNNVLVWTAKGFSIRQAAGPGAEGENPSRLLAEVIYSRYGLPGHWTAPWPLCERARCARASSWSGASHARAAALRRPAGAPEPIRLKLRLRSGPDRMQRHSAIICTVAALPSPWQACGAPAACGACRLVNPATSRPRLLNFSSLCAICRFADGSGVAVTSDASGSLAACSGGRLAVAAAGDLVSEQDWRREGAGRS